MKWKNEKDKKKLDGIEQTRKSITGRCRKKKRTHKYKFKLRPSSVQAKSSRAIKSAAQTERK